MDSEPTRDELLAIIKTAFSKHPEFHSYLVNPRRATDFRIRKPKKRKVKK